MLFNEPSRTAYDLNFSLLGIPVRVHPLFWLVTLLLGLGANREPSFMLVWVGAVFLSILVHEMGHALAAKAHGWQPWITLHGFGGLASYQPTYHSTASQLLITLAGPGAGFLFALLLAGVIAASGHPFHYVGGWEQFIFPFIWEPYEKLHLNILIFDLFYINIFWGLVNLLPIFPLDGGRISQELFVWFNGRNGAKQALWLSIIVAGGLAVLALTRLHDQFLAMFLAYLAYTSYMTLRANFGSPGGYGGYR